MSYADCIQAAPQLSDKKKLELINEYEELVKRYTKSMGDVNAAHAAAKKFVELKERQITKEMENTVRDALAAQDIKAAITQLSQKYDAEKAAAPFGKFLWGNSTGMAVRRKLEDINTAQVALEERTYRALNDLLEKYRSKAGGFIQDHDGFKRVVDELLGKNTGDVAAAADAKALREVFDILHKQYEDAGGIMGKLENYFPQRHNVQRVGRVSNEDWKQFVIPLLDRNAMIDETTGLPYTDEALNKALDKSYESISTNGLNEIIERAEEGLQTPNGRPSGVAKRHGSSRFLHFRDADAFHKYNQQFGDGDENLFEAMIGHIHAMTRDVALLQQLGPNPDGQLARMKMLMRADNASETAQNTAQGMFDVMAGRTTYSGAEPAYHRAVRDLQNWMRSAYLGGAPVSAMSDTFYAAATAKYNGLPATGVLREYVKYLNPADAADRQIARRNAFVSGAVSGMSIRNARFADDMGGAHRWSRFMANFTHRMSGLGIMTDAVRSAPVLQTHGFMADAAARKIKWEDLHPNMREAFERWDMNETDYQNIIRSKPWTEPEYGGDFLRPEDVAASGHLQTAKKYELWLTDMSQSASNEPRLLTRYINTGGFKQGTNRRLAASSIMMFKSFGITVLLNHSLPALRMAAHGKIGRIAAMSTVLPLLAAMSIQSRNVLYGKTTQDMDNTKFWAAAMMQGGGFGILGDFFFADYSRFNQSMGLTLLGPTAGFADDLARTFAGNLYKAIDENQESTFLRDLTRLATSNIPMVKLWYTRLVLERAVLDQLERATDPSFDARIRRVENKMRREKGQEFYWRPGQL